MKKTCFILVSVICFILFFSGCRQHDSVQNQSETTISDKTTSEAAKSSQNTDTISTPSTEQQEADYITEVRQSFQSCYNGYICPYLIILRDYISLGDLEKVTEIGNMGREALPYAEVRISREMIKFYRQQLQTDQAKKLSRYILDKYADVYDTLNDSEKYNYSSIQLYDEAYQAGIDNYKKLLKKLEADKNSELYGLSANQLCYAYNQIQEYALGIPYGKIACQYRGDNMAYNNLVIALENDKKYDDLVFYLKQAIDKFSDIKNVKSLLKHYEQQDQIEELTKLLTDYVAENSLTDSDMASLRYYAFKTNDVMLKIRCLESSVICYPKMDNLKANLLNLYSQTQQQDKYDELLAHYVAHHNQAETDYFLLNYHIGYSDDETVFSFVKQWLEDNQPVSLEKYLEMMDLCSEYANLNTLILDDLERALSHQTRIEIEVSHYHRFWLYKDNVIDSKYVSLSKEALLKNPTHRFSLMILAYDAYNKMQYQEAYHYLKKVNRQEQQTLYADDLMINCLLKLSKFDEATQFIDDYEKNDDYDRVTALVYSALLASAKGEDDKAIACLREVDEYMDIMYIIEYYPQFEQYEALLKEERDKE